MSYSPAAIPGTTTSPVELRQTLLYGHSYAQGNFASANLGYAQRVARRLNLGTVTNRSAGGTTSHHEALVQPAPDYNSFLSNGGTFISMLDSVINDAIDALNGAYGGGTTLALQQAALNKFTNMKNFHLTASARSGSAILDTAGSYTGTWTANTGDAEAIVWNGGAAGTSHSTTTLNDFVTFSGLTAGSTYMVILQGIDDGKAATHGAAFSITASGMTTITGTASNQFYQGRDTMTRSAYPVRVTLPGGATALTITKTDASGTVLYVNALVKLQAVGTRPWSFLMKAPYVLTSADNTTVDRFNSALAAVATAWGNDGIVLIDPNANGWNTATMLYTDNLHPNDRGHGFLADLYVLKAQTIPYGTAGTGRSTTVN